MGSPYVLTLALGGGLEGPRRQKENRHRGLGLGFGFGLGLGLGPRSRSRRHGTGEGGGGQAVGGGGMTRGAEGGAWVQGWGARAGRAARACGVPAAVPRAGETPQQAICRSKGAERVKGR